jgi:hypothetical protein
MANKEETKTKRATEEPVVINPDPKLINYRQDEAPQKRSRPQPTSAQQRQL